MGGKIIYQGPSLLDGAPIVVVAIESSRNAKTGNIVQTYIQRSDVDPVSASRTGQDKSICGGCVHRGKAHNGDTGQALGRSCYVLLGQGPTVVWKGVQRGLYDVVSGHAAIAAIGRGRMVRIGTYGDGTAVPAYVWDSLISEASGWTAYSHQAGNPSASFDPKRYMQSVESKSDAMQAWGNGIRTFRVVPDVLSIVQGKEILCPASKESGNRTSCLDCKLCAGTSVKAKSIAIVAHGAGTKHAMERAMS